MFGMMSRKQVVLLASVILMIALITNIGGWIQNTEANPNSIITTHLLEACVDTDHGSQSDICQSVKWTSVVEISSTPHPSDHAVQKIETNSYSSTGVTSCNQCPNPPFDEYN